MLTGKLTVDDCTGAYENVAVFTNQFCAQGGVIEPNDNLKVMSKSESLNILWV